MDSIMNGVNIEAINRAISDENILDNINLAAVSRALLPYAEEDIGSDTDGESSATKNAAVVTEAWSDSFADAQEKKYQEAEIRNRTLGAQVSKFDEYIANRSNPSVFHDRDVSAVEYSKSLLNEGDTLVYINYPNNINVYDVTGFALKKVHRVHSDKLLQTGSKIFTKMLGDWEQHKIRRRTGHLKGPPPGIKYILDLTPPEEGDEALDLTTDLSCSPGILKWSRIGSICGVSGTMVGGRDEVVVPNIPVPELDPSQNIENISPLPLVVLVADEASGDFKSPETTKAPITSSPKDNEFKMPITSAWTHNTRDRTAELQFETTLESPVDPSLPQTKETIEQEKLLDYCPIRHRAGIERLLQIIEGKNPRLDSAPKVWTLTMLAKYFDCATAVVDYVVTWVLADPNCRFIEILPEATLRMGMALQNPTLTRAAYAVLVSEEAVRIGANAHWPDIDVFWLQIFNNQEKDNVTRFGRPRESLDDDTINMIQHAGRALSTRAVTSLESLLGPEVSFLESIPEFQKIRAFEKWAEDDALHNGSSFKGQVQAVRDLVDGIRHYYRGRVLHALMHPLQVAQINLAKEHRRSVNYNDRELLCPETTYNSLTEHQKILTRDFWQILNSVSWKTPTNEAAYPLPEGHPFYQLNFNLANAHGIENKSLYALSTCQSVLNREVEKAVSEHGYNDGRILLPTSSWTDFATKPEPDLIALSREMSLATLEDSSSRGRKVAFDSIPLEESWTVFDQKQAKFGTSNNRGQANRTRFDSDAYFSDPPASEASKKHASAVLEALRLSPNSVYFGMNAFIKQFGSHISSLASQFLNKGEYEWSMLCETVLCLDDNEYKYLPLWAGGHDDGSGGVYEDIIPPAERGPAGPGPSFHTGSTANSVASSDIDFDGRSSVFGGSELLSRAFQSSMGVEDGHSDHIDRRLVVSDDGFRTPGTSTTGGSTVAGGDDDDDDDFFLVENEDEDFNLDSDDDGTLTDRE